MGMSMIMMMMTIIDNDINSRLGKHDDIIYPHPESLFVNFVTVTDHIDLSQFIAIVLKLAILNNWTSVNNTIAI